MTCIVAIKTKGKVTIGADSAGVAGLSIDICANPKIYRNEDFLFGFTSSFRMGQLLGYSLKVPKRNKGESVEFYMNTVFVDSVRACLKSGGYAEVVNGVESGGTFIIGYSNRIFVMDSDFQIFEPKGNFVAVGCGHDIAKGSLYSTERGSLSAYYRAKEALEAAERFSAGVRKPFVIREL